MKRKFLAGLLSLCIMFSLFPTAVFAEEVTTPAEQPEVVVCEAAEDCQATEHKAECAKYEAPTEEPTEEPAGENPTVVASVEETTPTLPNATVTVLDPLTLKSGNYTEWSGRLKEGTTDRPLEVVMNFKANDNLAQAQDGGYGKWIVDFYLTVSGMSGDSIIANNSYLAGNYGTYGWIVIPADGMEIENGKEYPIVSTYDANLTYENICDYVKDFTAAIHIAPEILEANQNMQVKLALKMKNPDDASDVLVVGEPAVYDITDLMDCVAKVGDNYYATLKSAIEAAPAGAEVVLLKDVEGSGIEINKDITINFNGHTYTVVDPTVGSEGTKTNGFWSLKGNNVKYVGGTITTKVSKAHILLQNYANLTLEDMTVTGNEYTRYVLSLNNGTIALNGNTNVTAVKANAADKTNIAVDVYDYKAGGYSGVNVTINTTGTINGGVLITGDGTNPNPTVTVENGNFESEIDAFEVRFGTLTINNATVEAGIKNDASWCAVWANGGKVIINNGTFNTGTDAGGNGNDTIYTKNGGSVEIYGGIFSTDKSSSSFSPDQYSVLNENDANRGTIKVYGGTYVQFNPANNSSEGTNTNFVADGKHVCEDGDNFVVHGTTSVSETAATCTADGTAAHYTCDAGKLFNDAAGTTEVTAESLVIKAKGHAFGGWYTPKAATCAAAGYEARVCACGATETRALAATGLHSYNDQGYCTTCGGFDASKVVATPAPTAAPTVAPTPAPTATPAPEATPEATPAPEMPAEADTTVTEIVASEAVVEAAKETVVVSEGTATVDTAAVEKIVEATAEEETAVVIPVAQATEEVVNKAEVDTAAFTAVAEAEKDVVIELSDVTVKLDKEAVKAVTEQAGGATIEIRAVKTETHTLTETQQAAIADKETALVVTAQIFSNGEYIGDFKGGKATIMLPFTPEEGKAGEDHAVYFVDDNGDVTKVPSEYVDGYMVFTTAHFSDYAIVYEGAALGGETETVVLETPVEAESSFPIIPIVIVIAIIVVGGVIFMIKKRNAED